MWKTVRLTNFKTKNYHPFQFSLLKVHRVHLFLILTKTTIFICTHSCSLLCYLNVLFMFWADIYIYIFFFTEVVVVPTAEILINFVSKLTSPYYLYSVYSPSTSSVLDSLSKIRHSNFQIKLAHHEVFVSHSSQPCKKRVALQGKRSITEPR